MTDATATDAARIAFLDVLRGFALLGILLVNMDYHSMPLSVDFGYSERVFPDWPDRIATFLTGMFFDGKFILLFSFLFGYGLHLQIESARRRGVRPWPRYGRRMLVLWVFGILHGVLLFVGDILASYAVLGALLFLFRNWPVRRLLIGALVCWAITVVMQGVLGWLTVTLTLEMADGASIAAIYSAGTFGQIVTQRASELVWLAFLGPFLFGPQIFGAFLLGLACAKAGWLRDLPGEAARWRRLFWLSFPIALLGNAAFAALLRAFDGTPLETSDAMTVWAWWGRGLFTPLGSLAYLSGLAWLLSQPHWLQRLAPLGETGKMSLSNYLLQSLLAGAVFLSWGLGPYGSVGPLASLGLALLIFALQVGWSRWWLTRFPMGPAEGVLRAVQDARATRGTEK